MSQFEPVVLTTSFNLLKKAGACEAGYRILSRHLGGVRKYGRDTPINLLTILESNGPEDMLWCLRATDQDCSVVSRLMAADFAESILHIFERDHPDDDRPRKAIEASRAFALGEVTEDVLAAAWDAAWAAARDAARDAALAAALAAARDAARDAALAAAWAAARDAARDAQKEIIKNHLCFGEAA